MYVCCECCVLSGRGLCDELITHPEESYRLWCVIACDLETSRMRRPWPALGHSATAKKRGGDHLLLFLISNFRRVVSVVCFLVGNSLASEFYMLTFQNTLSVPSS